MVIVLCLNLFWSPKRPSDNGHWSYCKLVSYQCRVHYYDPLSTQCSKIWTEGHYRSEGHYQSINSVLVETFTSSIISYQYGILRCHYRRLSITVQKQHSKLIFIFLKAIPIRTDIIYSSHSVPWALFLEAGEQV